AGVVPRQAAFALAAWSEVVRREAAAGREVDDPRAAELRHVVLDAGGGDAAAAGAADVARALVGLPGLLPPDVAGDAGLVAAVVAEVAALAAVRTAVCRRGGGRAAGGLWPPGRRRATTGAGLLAAGRVAPPDRSPARVSVSAHIV